jgi:Ca2+-binding EF-hand superfamily protein
LKYANPAGLRDALKLFDFDNDGRIKFEEFEYFMRNFGTTEAAHITEERMQKLLELCR